ncbi:MAG TPA: lytic transglycosylase domain-containing protein [Solirubrobacteraceae bacterium]|jgi:soluble lytic murein transglycosylase
MSTHAANARRRAPARRSRASARKRLAAIALAALAGALLVMTLPQLRHAAREIALPLRHEDVIRQQAAEKGLDPSLIAAVIYAESHFADRTSRAGARGLMQLTPQTARAIAQRTGGVAFREADLATPQVNISYGAWYLRHLLDHYGGDEVLALAAYNAGLGNVDRWLIQGGGGDLGVDDLPFPETRAYVHKVLRARADYRREYRRELGL